MQFDGENSSVILNYLNLVKPNMDKTETFERHVKT